MALQYSVAVNNAGLDGKIAAIGPAPTMKVFSGDPAPNCAAGDPTGLLCAMKLPANWMTAARDGRARSVGRWKGEVTADGRARSFRIYDRSGRCALQGAISDRSGTGEIRIDDVDLVTGQNLFIDAFGLAAGNGQKTG